MSTKISKITGGLMIISLLITGCGINQENTNKISSDNDILSQENHNRASIAGTYVEDSPSQSLLSLYDDGTLRLGDNNGTYDKVGDSYILSIDGYGYKLKAEITDSGNLYITSDSSNWDAEIYIKHTYTSAENGTIELADSIGNNWENFCAQTNIDEYEQFETVEEYEDGTFDLIGDLGTEIEVFGDGNLFCIGIGDFESDYTLCGAYIGQDYTEAEKSVTQYGMDCFEERVYYADKDKKYNSSSIWRCEQFDLHIFERGETVVALFASWND